MATEGSSKKLINGLKSVVSDCLQGLVSSNPGLALLRGHLVVVRSDLASLNGRVALVSGGGSGHEPAHAGYVGRAMLTAAVCGQVFTSPPVSSILATLRAIAKHGKVSGILLIVKNYTGDRINFGLALERARAEGISCEMVVVGEDCALTSTDKSAGRRGLAGTVLVHKIAGAMAENGSSLEEIVNFVKDNVLGQMGTIGLSLSPCSLPGSGPSFKLGDNEMELGLGIHGEAGVKRTDVKSAEESVKQMLDHMKNPDSSTHLPLATGDEIVILINNLGGTSNLEMGIVSKGVLDYAKDHGLKVKRIYVGAFMTALEMAGISLTVLKSTPAVVQHLDSNVGAVAWPRTDTLPAGSEIGRVSTFDTDDQDDSAAVKQAASTTKFTPLAAALASKAVEFVSEALISCENQLNIMDSGAGDGDCGRTFCRGAEKLLEKCKAPASILEVFATVSNIAEEDMGGSAGAMYSIVFATAASCHLKAAGGDPSDPKSMMVSLHSGVKAMMKYGGASVGDRTMVDALVPAFRAFEEHLSQNPGQPLAAFEKATIAAENGAQATLKMKASAGRASYVSSDQLKHPDPGAHAVGIIFRAIYQAILLKLNEAGYKE